MTTPERPDNPFAASGVGTRYALGRPYHHPHALRARVDDARRRHVSSGRSTSRAAPGMSTRALTEIADVVIGVDRSPEMLAVARGTKGRRSTGRRSCAARRSRCRSAMRPSTRSPCVPASTGSTRNGSSPKSRGCCAPGVGSRCTTTTSSVRWSTSRSSPNGAGARSSASRCRRATTRSAIRVVRRRPASRRSATSSTPTTSR